MPRRFILSLAVATLALFSWTRAQEPSRTETSSETPATETEGLPDSWAASFKWRSIGPAAMGGRITAIAVSAQDPNRWWAATASGGLLRTTNNGTTFEHQFDREAVVSIGDVAVAPSNHDIVWVGTGEHNPRNSVSWGNGVYKSVDGGKTWTPMGLERTFQTGRVVIHPTNPDIVYVGALGRLWGPNEERGLYKTTDGGKTWNQVLRADDMTGVMEMRMHPRDPETLLVATYTRQRDGFDTNDPAVKWSTAAGLHKTTDGGRTWRKVTGGLPTGELGRIGIDWWQKNPDVVYMVLESDRIGKLPEKAGWIGARAEDIEAGAKVNRVTDKSPAQKAGLKEGDVVVAVGDDRILSADDLTAACRRREAGQTVKIDIVREKEPLTLEVALEKEPPPRRGEGAGRGRGGFGGSAEGGGGGAEAAAADRPAGERPAGEAAAAPAAAGPEGERPAGEETGRGGGRGDQTGTADRPQEPERIFGDRLGGQNANVQKHQAFDGHEYAGVFKSTDGGETWTRVNSLNPRPMYFSQIRVDPNDENLVWVLGISLHRSKDGGKTFTGDGGRGTHADHHAMWIDPRDGKRMILGNDGGIYVTYDRGDTWDHLNHVAIGQFYHVEVDSRRDWRAYGGLQDNGSWGTVGRGPAGAGPANEDVFRIGGGDGFVCRVDPDDPDQIYCESQNGSLSRRHLDTGERGQIRPERAPGSNYRFNWQTPFVLSRHNPRIYYTAGNHVFKSLDRGKALKRISPEISRTERGSATSLAESAFDPDTLFVGTDDGALWRTKDGGREWTDLFKVGATPAATPDVQARAGTEAVPATLVEGRPAEVARGDRPAVEPAALTRPASERTGVEAPAGDPPAGGEPPAGERGGRGGGGFVSRLMERDANKDGLLQKGEMSERMAGLFDRADANGDGSLDPSEIETMSRNFGGGGRRGGRGEGGGRGETAAANGNAGTAPAPTTTPKDGTKPISQIVPGPRWISDVVCSKFDRNRVYLTMDGHRSDDDAAYVFVSENGGDHWRSLTGDLPKSAGSVHTLAEDIVNRDILYLGTEFAAWISLDRGAHWTKMNGNLPTVAVHGFAQHPTSGEIVAATHGRSLWVFDATPVRQMTRDALAADATLYKPGPAIIWKNEPSRGSTNRRFTGENPPAGAQISYSLVRNARELSLEIRDTDGKVIRNLEAKTEAGFHTVTWDLRRNPRTPPAGTGTGGGAAAGFGGGGGGPPAAAGGGGGGGGFGRRGNRAGRVPPGLYKAVLVADGKTFTQDVTVETDPDHPRGPWVEAGEFFGGDDGEEETEEQEPAGEAASAIR